MKKILFFVLCFLLFTTSFAESSETLEEKSLWWNFRRLFKKRHHPFRRAPVRRFPIFRRPVPIRRVPPIFRRPIVPKLNNFCSAWGDPHYTQSFTNKKFNNYRVGDYVIVQTPKFTVHSRQRPWGKAAVAVRMAVKPNLGRTKFEVQSASKQILNGRTINMRVGQIIKFKAGGYVHRHTAANFKVVGVDGDYIDMRVNTGRGWPQSHYIDFTMYIKNPYGAKGLCMGPTNIIPAHGLFYRFVPPKKLSPLHIRKMKLLRAEKMCRQNRVPKKFLKQCATDLILSNFRISPLFYRKFFKLEKKDKKKVKKMIAKKKLIFHARKVHHFCRASGDPHFLSFFNERFDNYQVGDFVLAETKHFAVHSRQRPWHRAAVNVKIVVRANMGTVFELESTSRQFLNHKPINMKIGQTIKFKRGGYVHRKSKNSFKVEGMTGDYIDMVVNEGKNWPQKHYIDFVMMLRHPRRSRGLCNSSKQKIPAHGLFHKFVAPKKLKPLKYSKVQFNRAIKMCKRAGVNGKNLKQCAIDVILSNFKISPKRTVKIIKLERKDQKKFRKVHPKVVRRRVIKKLIKRKLKKLVRKLKRSKRFKKLSKRKQRKLVKKLKKIQKRRVIKKLNHKRHVHRHGHKHRRVKKIMKKVKKIMRRKLKKLFKRLKRSKRFKKLSKRKQRKIVRRIKKVQKRRIIKKLKKRIVKKAKHVRRFRRFVKKVKRHGKGRKARRAQRRAARALRRAKRLQRKLQRKARRIARRQRRQQRRLQRKVRKAQKKAHRRPIRKLLKKRHIPSKVKRVIKYVEKKAVSLKHMIKDKLFKRLSRKSQKMIIRKVKRDRRRLGRFIKVRKYIKMLRAKYEAKLRNTIAILRRECAKRLKQAILSKRQMKVILRRKIKKDLLSSDKFAARLSRIVKREVIRQVGRKGCCKKEKRRRSRRNDDDDEDCDE